MYFTYVSRGVFQYHVRVSTVNFCLMHVIPHVPCIGLKNYIICHKSGGLITTVLLLVLLVRTWYSYVLV